MNLNELYPHFFRLCVESAVFFNVNVPPRIRGYIYGTHVTEEFLELLIELEDVELKDPSTYNSQAISEECRDVLFYLCCLQGSTGISFEMVEGIPNPAKLLGSLKRSFLRETPAWDLKLHVGIILNHVVGTLRKFGTDNDFELYQLLQEKLWARYPKLCDEHRIPAKGAFFDLSTPSRMLQRWEQDRNYYVQQNCNN